MNDENIILESMAIRQLPGRVNAEQAAKVLGFTLDDLTILMGDTRLNFTPLGKPAPNAPKFFAAAKVLRWAGDADWLDKATNTIRKHHLDKRQRYSPLSQN